MPKHRLLGGILLVAGTTIGAGMLGLPVITAFAGFWPSVLLMVLCWSFMLLTGFWFLDVNLSFKGGPNLISIAGSTLGTVGKICSWVFYLLLLYSLLSAYIAGSSPLFIQAIASLTGYSLPAWAASLILPILFSGLLYLSTQKVDRINRYLMLGLIVSYALLAVFIPPHSHLSFLSHCDISALLVAVTVLFTSFGYHIVIPTLTVYMEYDRRKLRLALLIGSLIPLLIYILWQFLIHSSIPSSELILAWKRGEPATVPLAKLLQNSIVVSSANFFSFFAIVTSFLGVSLSLTHFLEDGLNTSKTVRGRFFSLALTFLPPVLFVSFYKKAFYFALEYAGALVAILLAILPACMAWTLKEEPFRFYRSWKGRFVLLAVIALSFFIVAFDCFSTREFKESFIAEYLDSDVQTRF